MKPQCILEGHRVKLIPYGREHVEKYHGWMQNELLQELTASEPLSLEEEFAMRDKWELDDDKFTYIIVDKEISDIHGMIGDVNYFFNDMDGDKSVAEVEIMIAEDAYRGKGIGKETLAIFIQYGFDCLDITKIVAKIGATNESSIRLFETQGFKQVSFSNAFNEHTLELSIEMWNVKTKNAIEYRKINK